MPEQTTNYDLIKQLPSEFYNRNLDNQNLDTIDALIKALQDAKANGTDLTSLSNIVTQHLDNDVAHNRYGTATGTNTLVVTLSPAPTSLVAGFTLRFKNTTANTSAVTLNVNGLGAKSIVKSGGTALASGNLKAGGVYTVCYDGTNFILQGEGGSGNATASDLLSGKTATVDAGEITGTIPSKTAQTYTPGTTNQTITSGQYLSGTQTILGDADLIASNIKSGVNIFGVTGTVIEGKRWASGNAPRGTVLEQYELWTTTANSVSRYSIAVSGLNFLPSMIVIRGTDSRDDNVIVFPQAFGTDPTQYRVSIKGTNGAFEVTAPAYITNTGFKIPVSGSSPSYDWWAFE